MDNEFKAFTGAWIQAIGTVLSAISSTPIKRINEEQADDLDLIGNLLQGTGNALAADSESTPSLSKTGNEIQAIGNSIEVASYILAEGTDQDVLQIKGNLFQAVGGAMAFADNVDSEPSTKVLYSLYGNLLQVIGNSMQSIAGILELQGQYRQRLNTAGNWIQAIGAILTALSECEDGN
ncbi:DUF6944 family repetitive protein [Bacillus sp. AK031]